MTIDLASKSVDELLALARAYRIVAIQKAEAFPKLRGEPKRLAWIAMMHANEMAAACANEIANRG